MAPLTAARLIHFDEKCGNGAISKGEKCTKGQAKPAMKRGLAGRIAGNIATGAKIGAIFSGTTNSIKGAQIGAKYGGAKGAALGALAGAATGIVGGGLSGAAFGGIYGGVNETVKGIAKGAGAVTRAGVRGTGNIANALKGGSRKALTMRKKKKMKKFDPIAAAKSKEMQINR